MLIELPLGDSDGISRVRVDGFVKTAEEGAEMDEICGDGAIGAEAEGREVGSTLEGGGDFVLEGMRSRRSQREVWGILRDK